MIRQFLTAPNQLTLLRLIFIPFIIINLFDRHYGWALGLLVAAGLSDALDGLLARALKQQTKLGQYLDPIADKLLISTLFVVLSFLRKIPWRYTALVFSRDVSIIAIAAVLYATGTLREFRPSIFGKINTACQVVTVFLVVLYEVDSAVWIYFAKRTGLYATFAFTLISGIHYIILTGMRLRHAHERPQPAPSSH